MKAIELFSGIGGFAFAAKGQIEVRASVEIDRDARAVHQLNHASRVHGAELATLPASWFRDYPDSGWWMSPPCTPFTRRGMRRDIEDPRNRALLSLIELVEVVRPPWILLENVTGFEQSRTFERLQKRWSDCGYAISFCKLCPTELGWPNRRPRVYVMAIAGNSRRVIRWSVPQIDSVEIRSLIDYSVDEKRFADLYDPDLTSAYCYAIDRVDPGERRAVSACFTRAYGTSPIRSGSWLVTGLGLRRFSPAEVAILLGFPGEWRWPEGMSRRRMWQLLGNSLSIPAVRHVIRSLRETVENLPLGV